MKPAPVVPATTPHAPDVNPFVGAKMYVNPEYRATVEALAAKHPAEAPKLKKLADVGVTQFNIYLMCGEEEQTLENYKRDVLPGFS